MRNLFLVSVAVVAITVGASAQSVARKGSEDFSRGLNERTPIANIAPGIAYYLVLLPELSK